MNQVDRYGSQFDAEYSAVTDRFSAWIGYWPLGVTRTNLVDAGR